MDKETLAKVESILGNDVVLLPIKKGTKRPTRKAWTRLSVADTRKKQYLTSLGTAPAVGVALGKQSGGLCSIDFDDDTAIGPFLSLNPLLQSTLRTIGKRGCNLWLRVRGQYPRTYKLRTDGGSVGEWRADGGQTIIAGEHPDGGLYRFLVEAPPVEVEFAALRWGELRTPSSESSVSSASSESSVSSDSSVYGADAALPQQGGNHDSSGVLRLRMKREATRTLEIDPNLRKLYARYVERKFLPRAGERNAALVAMLPFLFNAVSRAQAGRLALLYYQLHADIFHDEEQQHRQEVEAHLTAVESRWAAELTEDERAALAEMDPEMREGWRLCRDLAMRDGANGQFFMSCNDLASRVRITPPKAFAILHGLCGLGVLALEEPGTRYTKGMTGPRRASVWRYLRPLPAPSSNHPET